MTVRKFISAYSAQLREDVVAVLNAEVRVSQVLVMVLAIGAGGLTPPLLARIAVRFGNAVLIGLLSLVFGIWVGWWYVGRVKENV